jgi:serine protease
MGRYFALIHGYSAFSGLSIIATYDDGSTINPEPTVYHFENTDDYLIPDLSFAGVVSPIEVPPTEGSGTIDLDIEIRHPAMEEVYIKLLAPYSNGYWVLYSGLGIDISQTLSIDLGNMPTAGAWLLKAIDFGRSGQGYIDNWSIAIR